MASPRILMCPPDHFTVEYAINPWMEGLMDSVDKALAHRQWQRLHDAIGELTAVETADPAPGLPDMPFSANAGVVYRDVFVPSRFRHAQRQPEAALFARWFAERGYTIRELPDHLDFEGAGDALFDRGNGILWCGHGPRSDKAVADTLADLLGVRTIALHLAGDPRYYHLDTCFCPLTGGDLLYFPPAFDQPSLELIAEHVPEARRIAVTAEDAATFACNAVNIGRHVILNRAGDGLRGRLADAGFRVIECGLGEFIKAGGSAKCLTLRIDEPEEAARAA